MNRRPRTTRTAVLLAALAALVTTLLPAIAAHPASAAPAADPTVAVSNSQAGVGGSITVTGKGWRPDTLLMMLICGQNMIGGTNSCANADGRAVTTDGTGAFSKKLPVAAPPKPCPCVVHVAAVTGEQAVADAEFKVAGHPTAPLPEPSGDGRLAILTDTRLDGSSGVLTWFGAPPSRTLVFTVGNLGASPVKDPVFQVGTAHGVFAPQWEDQQWRGTVAPGRKAQIRLPVELSAGAHGGYLVSVRYGGKVLAEQPWGVGRPWGVTLFWVLLCVVVPAAVFRIGMAVVDRVRPRGSRHPAGPARTGRHRGVSLPDLTVRLPKLSSATPKPKATPATATATTSTATTPTLPWFTPDTDPGPPTGRLSAPSTPSEEPPTNTTNTQSKRGTT
ncbi:hypothetical protein ACFVT5_09790 [Streptomyces sp. NPDC058001]|uniref:hypothetical protein n=1 Tax=Streptomyces sp. NPDC058001 TaxID=3346300 RepID=UPI0036E2F92F